MRPKVPEDAFCDFLVAPPPPTYATPFAQILSHLNLTTRSFFRTAEALSSFLQQSSDLDWSPAVIALCKAFELETVQRIMLPLRMKIASEDLSADIKDKDFGRIAKFCNSSAAKPPELGTFAHSL